MSRQRARQGKHGPVHGVLVVDKPSGPTSHDVVAAARRHFGTRRVGHAGTLDPLATGVLVLLFGEATKLSAHLTRDRKTYVADVVFGTSTVTLDKEGAITRRRELTPGWLSAEVLEAALEQERGRTLQVPPAVSAIKVDGKRAHARTRSGETFDLAPRDVSVHEARLLDWSDQGARVELSVSKGYYVRAFARDLGEALGVPAHLGALRRTRSGPFDLESAVPFPPPRDVRVLPLAEAARRAFSVVELTEEGELRAQQGKLLLPGDYEPEDALEAASERPWATLACLRGNRLVALAEPGPSGALRIVRGIHDAAGAEAPDGEGLGADAGDPPDELSAESSARNR